MHRPTTAERPMFSRSDSQRSDASDSPDDSSQNAEYSSSTGIFELETDTPGVCTSESDNDELSVTRDGRQVAPKATTSSSHARVPIGSHSTRTTSVRRDRSGSWGSSSASSTWQTTSAGRHPRTAVLSSTPSFSSPLAMAPTLPDDLHQDLISLSTGETFHDDHPNPSKVSLHTTVHTRAASSSSAKLSPRSMSKSVPTRASYSRSYSAGRRLQAQSSMAPPPLPRSRSAKYTGSPEASSPISFSSGSQNVLHTPLSHRRAHSATTMNFNDASFCCSPVGGVDGVDPQLIAAIGPVSDPTVQQSNNISQFTAPPALAEGADIPSTPTFYKPESSLHSPPDYLAGRMNGLHIDSPSASPAPRRADGLRLQRVPRAVAMASNMVPSSSSRPRTRRASQIVSPQPSPTEGNTNGVMHGLGLGSGLGLGLGLPSLDIRRSRSVDENDTSISEPQTGASSSVCIEDQAYILSASRLHKLRQWKKSHANWTDWKESLTSSTSNPRIVERAIAHGDAVSRKLTNTKRIRSVNAGLATAMHTTCSLPDLKDSSRGRLLEEHRKTLDRPKSPIRFPGKSDVFGQQRSVRQANNSSHDTRIVSDCVPSAAPKLISNVRRQNTTMSVDDTVAEQRQKLWNEVLQAKSVCDTELARMLTAMLEYTEHVASINELSPDTTVQFAEEIGVFDTFAELDQEHRPSDAALEPLQTMAEIATELRTLSLHALLSQRSLCRPYIAKIQALSTVWDEHPDWHGRGWYVELLLTVATLSRVLEWWDAEHRFWAEESDDFSPARQPSGKMLDRMEMDSGFRNSLSNKQMTDRNQAVQFSPHSPSDTHNQSEASHSLASAVDLSYTPATSQNVLMELSLDDERIMYISPAWKDLAGTAPEQLIDVRIASLLSTESAGIFSRATKQLRDHPEHTVELVFELADWPKTFDKTQSRPARIIFEAQGMLIRHCSTRRPLHTMWALHLAEADTDVRAGEAPQLNPTMPNSSSEGDAINTELLLCRICEREIPAWFFAKHSEICHEVHRLEMEIGTVNELLHELNTSARELLVGLEHAKHAATRSHHHHHDTRSESAPECNPDIVLAYRGTSIKLLSSTESQAKHVWSVRRNPLSMTIIVQAIHTVEKVVQLLEAALAISTPSVRDEAPEDFTALLSPQSERNVELLRAQRLPHPTDKALRMLVADVREATINKVHAVNRMRNTIVYVETVRIESEQKVTDLLDAVEEGEEGDQSADQLVAEPHTHEQDYVDEASGLLMDHSEEPNGKPNQMQSWSSRLLEDSPTKFNSTATEREDSGGESGILFDPRDDTDSGKEDEIASSTDLQPPASIIQSPIPIPNTRQEMPRSRSTTTSSPRTIPMSQTFGNDARHLSVASPKFGTTPTSPSMVPRAQSKATAASIKDFEVLKPISKGAYGSVFLARKRATGDLFAVKVLKKSDMIAKNQITNVRAERMILMNRTQSPFVVKLFFTFQSLEYLYLVMEYLPGGDCASLVKMLGELPEDWAKQYLAEIVNGLAYLHSTGVVHRDMKPDNLLIDQRGHLKLTDFGLSKFGLLGRHTRSQNNTGADPLWDKPSSIAPISTTWAQLPTEESKERSNAKHAQRASVLPMAQNSEAYFHSIERGPAAKRVVGTPDYLAPETIMGLGMDEFGVDWWAVGVILFEFLSGYPPFHASTPNQVFDKILTRSIDWDTDAIISDDARDLIERLICTERQERLGARGVDEIRTHPFFQDIDWDHLTEGDGPFVPKIEDAASTDYFDSRGALPQSFDEEHTELPQSMPSISTPALWNHGSSDPARFSPNSASDSSSERPLSFNSSVAPNEFGSFSYKNLPVLKQANDEMVRRIRTETLTSHSSSPMSSHSLTGIPSRPTFTHRRAHSDLPRSVPRSITASGILSEGSGASAMSESQPSSSGIERSSPRHSHTSAAWFEHLTGSAAIPVLVADFNPVSRRVLEVALKFAGANPTIVEDGAEMCRLAMGDTKYAVLFVKLALQVINGQDVARMIKSTRNINSTTPIVALMLGEEPIDPAGSIFNAIVNLPASHAQLVSLVQAYRDDPLPSPNVVSPTFASGREEASLSMRVNQLQL
ncbi:non-specific serine/threonine protein kinase [Malassezia yamatoensis]|uniref:non-specific serine/threonine protein kinase n=1 Tax=Malassezia yamatoensis TaxID=253288 RepID=A0AAJ6CFG5_9BASI|nr:non-specific serine/threonine protein kinase [Malassezia yamatoensis]